MEEFTVESKSKLAKLLAGENISIEHQKVRTAAFDLKNRILYLPIWKDMEGYLYDSLTGHEVAHALYTPEEGWHDAVSDDSRKGYNHFLNVIEDARVEKKFLRRFPGLKASFRLGYADMWRRGFFGDIDDPDELEFIDKVNIRAKISGVMEFDFTDEELVMLEAVDKAETWDDVVSITDIIYEYSKRAIMLRLSSPFPIIGKDCGDGEGECYFGRGEKEESVGITEDDCINYEVDEFPVCSTDMTFRKMNSLLIDPSCKEYCYYNMPTPNLKNIIIPYQNVHSLLDSAFKNVKPVDYKQFIHEFKRRNFRYVNLLVKEFEMVRAAKIYSKSKTGRTGDIDICKLPSYKFDDNIFKSFTVTPDGESHGYIILLDGSGSMWSNMSGAIEQVIVMSMFCRKVNIKFDVYSFTNVFNGFKYDLGLEKGDDLNIFLRDQFTRNHMEINGGRLRLRHYLSSEMSSKDYTRAINNMIILSKSFGRGSGISVPQSEELGGTPLNSALIAMGAVMREFKSKYKLDKTGLIIVHDGESDSLNGFINEFGNAESFNTRECNVFIRDKSINFQCYYPTQNVETSVLLKWFKAYTGSKIVGFYIVGRDYKMALRRHYTESKYSVNTTNLKIFDVISNKLIKDKYIQSNNVGYDNFFFILGGKVLTSFEDFDIEDVSIRKLTGAFKRMYKSRSVSKSLVTKFIGEIA